MILIKEAKALWELLEKARQSGKVIGFVPTMGALHQGHISLVQSAKRKSNLTVASIFVNPTQFNDPKDFEKYPVTITNDILLLEKADCDVLFLPFIQEIYPEGLVATVQYDLGSIEHLLEGKYRPGHFQGVCQVVYKLLQIVRPNYLFMGQKDYQQCMVINQLIQLYNFPLQLIIEPTFRESSGLAMSSRNLRLTDGEKLKAKGIFLMLNYIKANYLTMSVQEIQEYAETYLQNNGFKKVDYISISDATTLQPLQIVTKDTKPVALIAAFIGDVRLIDNMALTD